MLGLCGWLQFAVAIPAIPVTHRHDRYVAQDTLRIEFEVSEDQFCKICRTSSKQWQYLS